MCGRRGLSRRTCDLSGDKPPATPPASSPASLARHSLGDKLCAADGDSRAGLATCRGASHLLRRSLRRPLRSRGIAWGTSHVRPTGTLAPDLRLVGGQAACSVARFVARFARGASDSERPRSDAARPALPDAGSAGKVVRDEPKPSDPPEAEEPRRARVESGHCSRGAAAAPPTPAASARSRGRPSTPRPRPRRPPRAPRGRFAGSHPRTAGPRGERDRAGRGE